MRLDLVAAVAACSAVAACGSSSSNPGSDASASVADGASDGARPADGSPADALVSDAGPSSDGPMGATIPCGSMQCNANTQYCYSASGGPPPPPDASGTSYACKDIPPPCLVNPACTCIQQEGGAGCPCSVMDGGFYVTCDFP